MPRSGSTSVGRPGCQPRHRMVWSRAEALGENSLWSLGSASGIGVRRPLLAWLAGERLHLVHPREALERACLELAHALARYPKPPSDLVERLWL